MVHRGVNSFVTTNSDRAPGPGPGLRKGPANALRAMDVGCLCVWGGGGGGGGGVGRRMPLETGEPGGEAEAGRQASHRAAAELAGRHTGTTMGRRGRDRTRTRAPLQILYYYTTRLESKS